jgi:hypothetical protein
MLTASEPLARSLTRPSPNDRRAVAFHLQAAEERNMIVRILADNQYRLTDEQMAEVDRLDDALEAALTTNDAGAFQSSLLNLTQYVQQAGEVVPVEEIVPSDVIIPSPDMSLDEARQHFTPYTHHAEPASVPKGEA